MWNRIVTADTVITRLLEDKGIYQMTNRSYDSLVRPGASSVRRPKLANLEVKKNTGTAANHADRKKTHTDTTMVETALDVYAVPILSEVVGEFESNDMLRREYEISASMSLKRQFNIDVITAAQATSNASAFAGATLAWDDLTAILKHFDDNEVPEEDRVIVISSALEQEFYNIDVIKTAIGFNMTGLRNGQMNQMLNCTWFISGLAPLVGGKAAVTGWYAKGLAFILSKEAVIKEAYSPEYLGDAVDLLAHAAAELDDDAFAVVKTKP